MLPTVRRCAPTSATSGSSLAHANGGDGAAAAPAEPAGLPTPALNTANVVSRAGGLPSFACFTQPTTSRSPAAGRAMRDHPAASSSITVTSFSAAFRLTTSFASVGPFGCAEIGTGADDRRPATWS